MEKKWRLAGLLILPLALGVPLLRAKEQRREIIELFTIVPGTDGCQAIDNSMWTSNDEVICVNKGGSVLERVNATTGKARKLAPLPNGESAFGGFGISVSPDGKWILMSSGTPQGAPRWFAAKLGSTQFVTRPAPARSGHNSTSVAAWLPDSTGWVEMNERFTSTGPSMMKARRFLRIYSLASAKVKEIDVPKADSFNDFQVTEKREAFIACAEPVSVRFVIVPLDNPSQTREREIEPPRNENNGYHRRGSLVSPRGDRIAWTFQKAGIGGVTESVWLSDIDGKKFEQLTPDLEHLQSSPIYLHWKPDSNGLSGWRPAPGQRYGGRSSLYNLNIPARLALKP